MHIRRLFLGSAIFLAALLAGCTPTPSPVPPTLVPMIITATPDPRLLVITVTPTGGATVTTQSGPVVSPLPPTATPASPSATPPALPTATQTLPPPVTVAPTNTPPPPLPSSIATTPQLSAFPTETRGQLYIVQEDFERGYMFWISNLKVIWVLFVSPTNPNEGEWRAYPDSFVEGEPEVDPNLTPPGPNKFQPRRGFGKLWRETPGLKDALGWATTPEFNLTTNYVYQPGGYLDPGGKYIAGPGTHFMMTLSRQIFALTESETGVGKWRRVG